MPRVTPMGRILRKVVLFALLLAGVVTPAAADPILMLLLGVARDMIESHASKRDVPAPAYVPDLAKVYQGTTVEPDHLRRLIDDSFPYLTDAQRKEIFASLNEALADSQNAAMRGILIQHFIERALTVRSAQMKLAELSWREKQQLAGEFR